MGSSTRRAVPLRLLLRGIAPRHAPSVVDGFEPSTYCLVGRKIHILGLGFQGYDWVEGVGEIPWVPSKGVKVVPFWGASPLSDPPTASEAVALSRRSKTLAGANGLQPWPLQSLQIRQTLKARQFNMRHGGNKDLAANPPLKPPSNQACVLLHFQSNWLLTVNGWVFEPVWWDQ